MTTQKPHLLSRRDFVKLSAFGAAAATLAACAPAVSPGAPAAESGAAAVSTGARQTVRYLSWWFEEGNRGITWNNFIKEFNESQKDIEVVAENIPFDQYTTKTIVGAQSGELDGDIVMATPELAPRLIRSNLLAPLDDILVRNNITDLSSAHDALRQDGKLYGLDMVTVAFGLLYNSDRYKEANITPATTPEDWIELSKALTNRDEQKYGFFTSHLVSEPSDFWFQLEVWCMPYGGKWAEGKTPLLTSEPIIKGLKLFKEMYDGAMPGHRYAHRDPSVRDRRRGARVHCLCRSRQSEARISRDLSTFDERAHPVGKQQVDCPHPPHDGQRLLAGQGCCNRVRELHVCQGQLPAHGGRVRGRHLRHAIGGTPGVSGQSALAEARVRWR